MKVFIIFVIFSVLLSGCMTMQPETVFLGEDTEKPNIIGKSKMQIDFLGAPLDGRGPSSAYEQAITDAKEKAGGKNLVNIKGFKRQYYWTYAAGIAGYMIGSLMLFAPPDSPYFSVDPLVGLIPAGGGLVVMCFNTYDYEIVAEKE